MADQTPQASKPTTPAVSTPTPTPGSGPTISSSASTSSSRSYVPQFSAATQLILQRLKAKEGKNDGSGGSISSVVSSPKTTVATGGNSPTTIKLEPDAFEDAKKRLVAGTGLKTLTSMSLKMPLSLLSMKMPTPAPTTTMTMTTTATKKSLSLPSSSVSTVARAASTANLSLPPPPPQPPKHKSLNFKSGTTSAIKNINSGLTASGKVSVIKLPKPAAAAAASERESKPKKAKTSTGNPVGRPSNSSKAAAAAAAAVAAATTAGDSTGSGHRRRKRIKQHHQDVDELSSLSSLSSDVSEPEEAASGTTPSGGGAPLPLTMTKSGRQVLKPTTYNPAAVDAANKKHRGGGGTNGHHHYGGKHHRTAEQALCKKCTRLHSPAFNPMVFCDGCNEGWHQRCHEPVIPTVVIRDQTKGWVCSACVAGSGKRERHLVGKRQQQQKHDPEQGQPKPTKESWADKPPQQKRAYLSTLPPQELVGLLMLALEVKPDLPIFPGPLLPSPLSASSASASAKVSHGNGNGNGNGNTKGSKSLKDLVLSRETSQEGEDEEEYDPLAALWPKPGNGLYSLLPFDVDDDEYLVDSGDFEAFSSIMYDDRGRKVLENGLRV